MEGRENQEEPKNKKNVVVYSSSKKMLSDVQ